MSLTVRPDPRTPWHSLDVDKTLSLLQGDRTRGLSLDEVQSRFHLYGPNELQETAGRTALGIFFDQFKNIMLVMLMAVAVVSAILDLRHQRFPKDAIAIMSIVILNGVLGYLQETRAEKALAALKRMANPRVTVIREDRIREVAARELVPGDLVRLEAGTQVAADGRLLDAVNLQIRESALTGESHAVEKHAHRQLPNDAPLGDRANMAFQGTEVVQGRGILVVVATGMETELGRIAAMLQAVETEPTPLQRRMTQLGNVLVAGSLLLVALVVFGGVWRTGSWRIFEDLLEVSLSMAVAVVPEGLPAVITVTLALGTQRMVRRKALIRRLPAVETLGSVTTICSDKTGTLTQNKMVVQVVETGSCSLRITGDGYCPEGEFQSGNGAIAPTQHQELNSLLLAGLLCNDAQLQQEQGEWTIVGDPTEGALLVIAGKADLDGPTHGSQFPRVAEIPFSSERKRMSVVVQAGIGSNSMGPNGVDRSGFGTNGFGTTLPFLQLTKGSPELTLERCTHIQVGDRPQILTPDWYTRILSQNDQMASQGLRVLGFAYKPLSHLPEHLDPDTEEINLIWLGLMGLLDAPRPEVREAVQRCRRAGIRPVMITGDHQLTAQAIALELGISQPGDPILSGSDLEKMDTATLDRQVKTVNVYARVSPEHKLRIVQSLQRQNCVVAMTGDGVNDAPALKQADIGIAMGITGTDVSKEASDMVLLDDNFATIVAAAEEGRVVYTNIRRFVKYILGSNIGEVLTIAASPILLPMGDVPLTPLQILWMNLVTDGLPALALAVEPAEPDVMNFPPHHPHESIFSRGLGAYMVRIGIIFSVLSITLMLWAFYYSASHTGGPLNLQPDRWKTMVFTTLCIAQMGHALAVRSHTRLTWTLNPFSNPFIVGAVVVTTLLQLALIYVQPLRNFFGTDMLSPLELAICFGFSTLMFVWVELEKLVIQAFLRWRSR